MNRSRQNKRQMWVAGDVMSWVLGVLLGGFLGTVLLIATPIMLRKAQPAASTATTSTTTAAAETPAAPAAETPTTPAAPPEAGKAPEGNAEAGKALFAACAGCHGANAAGGPVGPTLVAAKGPKDWTFEQFKLALHEGKAPEKELAATMPRQPQLTDQQLADLQAFIKTN